MNAKARKCALLGLAGLGVTLALGAPPTPTPEPGPWREARGLPRGTRGEVVSVRDVSEAAPATGGADRELRLVYALPALQVAPRPAAGAAAPTVLVLGNAPLVGDPGQPLLPVVPCQIALPAGSEVAGVAVVCGAERKLPGKHTLAHGQQPVPLSPGVKAQPAAPDAAVYGSDEPWPKARYALVTVQQRRGLSVLVVNLYPVVYRPLSGAVSSFATLELRVTTKAKVAALTGAGDGPPVRRRDDPLRPWADQVDNPATVETYRAELKGGVQ